MNDYYQALSQLVHVTGWIHGYHALSPQLHWAWHETAVMERLFPPLPDMQDYKNRLAAITRDSNDLLLRVVEKALRMCFRTARQTSWRAEFLQSECARFIEELVRERNAFVGRHQAILMGALEEDARTAVA